MKHGREQLSVQNKVGYFILGFVLTVFGVLIAWIMNQKREDSVKLSAITCALCGLAALILLYLVLTRFGIDPLSFVSS